MTSNIDIDEKQVETLESVPINFLLQTMCLSTYLFLNPLKVVCLLCHNVLNFFLSVFALCVHLLVHFVQQFFDFNLLQILFTCSRIFSPLSQATSSTSHGILPALLRVRLASALGVFGRIWRRVFGREAGGRTVVPSSGILKVTNLESLRILELWGTGEGMGLATWSSGFGSSPGLGSARGLDVLLTVRFLAWNGVFGRRWSLARLFFS